MQLLLIVIYTGVELYAQLHVYCISQLCYSIIFRDNWTKLIDIIERSQLYNGVCDTCII